MMLEKSFGDVELTSSQGEAVLRLEQFLGAAAVENCFLLKGYAGTGKTFLLQGLTRWLIEQDRPVVLLAPTGRAAKILSERTGRQAATMHRSIYSMKDLEEYRVVNEDGSETFRFFYRLRANRDDARTVYIVDEASMVSDRSSEGEFFRFGSGRLLTDFFGYMGLGTAGIERKVIFVGDDAQLPPCDSVFSPALSADYMRENFFVTTAWGELTDVVRQSQGSGILRNATALRSSLERGDLSRIVVDTSYPDTHHVDPGELLVTFTRLDADDRLDGVAIIAWSNRQVADYNRMIRDHYFPDCSTLAPGDRVLVVANNYAQSIPLLNGDFARVVDAGAAPEKRTVALNRPVDGKRATVRVELRFRAVTLTFHDLEGKPVEIRCRILENLLDADERDLTSDENKALYVDFKARHPGLKVGSVEFKEAIRDDPWFNAVRIKYGYAVTCHKAQGGEWKHVIVDFRTRMGIFSEAYFRWAYTAITRARSGLYTLSEPQWGLDRALREARAVDGSAASEGFEVRGVEKDELAKWQEQGGVPLLRDIGLAVQSLLRGSGIRVANVRHDAFCELYAFERNGADARFRIHYNSDERVTAVLAVATGDVELRSKVKELLQPLEGRRIVVPEIGDEDERSCDPVFPLTAPYLGEFFAAIKEKVEACEFVVSGVEHHGPYHEEYEFSGKGLKATVHFYFRSGGRYSRCIPDEGRSTSLALLRQVVALVGR